MNIDREKYFGEYSDVLRKLVPLSNLPEHKFEELIDQISLEKGGTNMTLFKQGDSKQEFVYLLEGEVEFRIGDIPLQTVTSGTPEATFALAHQFPRRTSAVALTPIHYLRIANDIMASVQGSSETPIPKHQQHSRPTDEKQQSSKPESDDAWLFSKSQPEKDSATPEQNPPKKPEENSEIKPMSASADNETANLFPQKSNQGIDRLKSIIIGRRKELSDTEKDELRPDTTGSDGSVAEKLPSNAAKADQEADRSRNKPEETITEKKKPADDQTAMTEIPANSNVVRPFRMANSPGPTQKHNALVKRIRFESIERSSPPKPPTKIQFTDKDMVAIAGKTLISAYDSKTLLVDPFLMDKTPVTNRAYLQYVQETEARFPEFWQCKGPKKSELDHPVTGISLNEARSFAEWCGKRLPTNREWEAASRPIGQFRFPWGDNWDPKRCNCPDLRLNETSVVGKYPAGASPEGCLDLIGNTWEWTQAATGESGIESGYCWVFGGSFRHACVNDNVIARSAVLVENRYPYLGFRCAKSLR